MRPLGLFSIRISKKKKYASLNKFLYSLSPAAKKLFLNGEGGGVEFFKTNREYFLYTDTL